MVYYIRFLEVPSIFPHADNLRANVKTAITVTTDLGDSFNAGELQLLVRLCCTSNACRAYIIRV